VRNYRSKPMHLKAGLVLPEGFADVAGLDVPVGTDGKTGFTVTIPDDLDPSKPRVAVAADIVADEQYFGKIVKRVVDFQFR
jgi:hypothetical protein